MTASAPSHATDVVVVGAGMAGITAARTVRAAGLGVVVVDKGRAPGGRMATRRIGGARFDHGAQHFSVRSARFRALVDGLMGDGVVREWFRSESVTRPERGVEVRHVGAAGMRSIVAHLASGLGVRTGIEVERLRYEGERIVVEGGDSALMGRALVLTPPVPQCLHLLDVSGVELATEFTQPLRAVSYDACLAVMAVLDRPSRLPDGHRAVNAKAVAWIADNQHKGISTEPAVTIHGTPGFSATYLDEGPERWVPALVAAARDHLTANVVSATGHRWRYAQPRATLDSGCAVVEGLAPIVLAGEVFAGARVEGAFRSGAAAGAEVVRRLR